MKKLLLITTIILCLHACSKKPDYGIVTDKSAYNETSCVFTIHTGYIFEPFEYTIDSCKKYNLKDTVLLKNLK